MSDYDGMINEFCWDYLEWVRNECSPFNKAFSTTDALCMNAMWWYRKKFGIHNSGAMRAAMEEIFFEEFGKKSYPFNNGGADFHDESDQGTVTTNPKRIAWATKRALMHKPIPRDPLDDTELHDANPNCKHELLIAEGGGIRCIKCPGWFCF